MNEQEIKPILEQLYAVDPGLRQHEAEIIPIIRALSATPKAVYDKTFALELRSRLLAELETSRHRPSFFSFLAGNPRYGIAGAIALVVVAVIAGSLFLQNGNSNSGPVALLSSGVNVTHVGSNAFGSLAGAQKAANSAGTGSSPSSPASAAALNSGAPAAAGTAANSGAATMRPMTTAPESGAAPSIVAYPYNPPVRYIYAGNSFSQNSSQLDVLKRVPAAPDANQIAAALKNAGFQDVDLSSLSNLSATNITLAQNQPFGYEINIDLQNGTVSINENYGEWPNQPGPASSTQLSDDAVIAIAKQFLADHGISTSNYGAPAVQASAVAVPMMETSNAAGAAAMPMIPYYPDSKQVIFPLLVNGMNVYDGNGNKAGLTMEVNMAYGRVTSFYGLETQNYQASAYDAITDTNTILSMAETTLIYPQIYNGMKSPSSGTVHVTTYNLETPSMGYVKVYKTDDSGITDEFLVPAFVFPVSGSNNNVVVPLIKDFEQNSPTGVVMPAGTAIQGSAGQGSAAAGTVSQ